MRAEHKYLVPKKTLPELRRAIAPFMELDKHGRGYEEEGYTVRSTYFDTPSLRYYYEKQAGIAVRRKLRIRGYNQADGGQTVFLEIKRKVESQVSKNRAPVAFANLPALFATGDVERYVIQNEKFPDALDDARRFFYHIRRYDLRPAHTTVYEREAFVGRFDATLRITFDRNLRGASYQPLDRLYDEDGLRHAFADHFILEVKYNTRFPAWLRPVLGRYDFRRQALSKYCICARLHGRHTDGKVAVLANARPVVPPGAAVPLRETVPPREKDATRLSPQEELVQPDAIHV